MKNKKLLLLSVCFIFWHFFAVSIYMLQGKFTPDFVYKACKWYVFPVFHQRWSMFAPPPFYDMKLLVNIEGEKEWFDPSQKHLNDFNANRFSSAGKICKIQDRILREIYTQVNIQEEMDFLNDTVYVEKSLDSISISEPVHHYFENILPDSSKNKYINVIYKSVFFPKFNNSTSVVTEHVFVFKPIFIKND